MKLSDLILGSLMLASSSVIAQSDTAKADSLELKRIQELEQRLIDKGYEKQIESIGADGKVTYKWVRTQWNCNACGMG